MSKRLKSEKGEERTEYWDNGNLKTKGTFKFGKGNGLVRRWNEQGICTSFGNEKDGCLIQGEMYFYRVSLASWHVDFTCTAKGTFFEGKLHGPECELVYQGCLWSSGKFHEGFPVAGESTLWFFKHCGEYCTLTFSKSTGFYPDTGADVYLATFNPQNEIIRTVHGKLRKQVFPMCCDDEEPEDNDPYYPLRDTFVLYQALMRGPASTSYGAIKFKGCCLLKVCLNFGDSALQLKCVPHGLGTIYEHGLPRSEFIFNMGFRKSLRSMFDEKGRLALQFGETVYSDSLDENGWPEYILGQAYSLKEKEKTQVNFIKGKLQYKDISKVGSIEKLEYKSGFSDMISLEDVKRRKTYWMLNQIPSDYEKGESPHIVSSSILIQLLKQSRPTHPITRAPIMRCTKVQFL